MLRSNRFIDILSALLWPKTEEANDTSFEWLLLFFETAFILVDANADEPHPKYNVPTIQTLTCQSIAKLSILIQEQL